MHPEHRQSLDDLYALRFFGVKLGLDTIRELLERLGNPHRQLRVVHIAGTNGKGSTAAAVAAVFHAAGISAGLYTSPHLHQFTERIRIDTHQIELTEVVELFDLIRPHAEALRATFFEVTTAMALLSFVRHGMQWAVLECGMGGRLDATNIVTPDVSVITPVALDHTRHLGTTLAQVAMEKGGIIKPGVPVVMAAQEDEAAAVLTRRARQQGACVILPPRDYHWRSDDHGLTVATSAGEMAAIRPRLVGDHQHQNLALAAATAALLADRGVALSREDIRLALERVCWPGRLEWLPQRVLLDGAHNQAGAQVLAAYLRGKDFPEIHLIFGCKADKQVSAMLKELLPWCHRFYATRPPVDEAAEPDVLVRQAEAAGVASRTCPDPAQALDLARQQRSEQGIILVAGSLFLVAALREAILPQTRITPVYH